MPLTLKQLTEANIPEIVRIERECFDDPWGAEDYESQFGYEGTAAIGLYDGDELVGTLVHTPDGLASVYIVNIAVLPSHRRRGVGTRLLQELFKLGAPVTLHVRSGNKDARSLYRRLGFRDVRTEDGYYDSDGEDAVVMLRV